MRPSRALIAAVAFLLGSALPGGAQEPVVRAILFYSPTCPHCHEVIQRQLPPLKQQYGDQLVVIGVDVTTPSGQELYQATVAYFAIPESRLGVPTLLVGTDLMVGSLEIPERFPGIIERGLATRGIDWPPVEEIRQVLAAQGLLRPEPAPASAQAEAEAARPEAARTADSTAPVAAVASTAPQEAVASGLDTASGLNTDLSADTAPSASRVSQSALFLRDPVGNGIAVAVLAVLLLTLAWSVAVMLRPGAWAPELPSWLFPTLAVAGMGIAAYLSFVEVSGTEAVCGPVGDCNTVQQSGWARLFGVVPIGVLGLAGYLALLGAWAAATWGGAPLRRRAWTAAWAMAVMGTAFSAWLTFLEPFVIGATCAWCISSALVMALMLAVATPRAAGPPPSARASTAP
ncbi:MAG: vitamin K epoxide reductase family protein [Longimicrobiales bacterium]|nr:vitamin K epoxide reductase family protein [Longimicrobiales bacterium]